MRIAGLAIGLFGASFLAHWVVWRLRMPRRHTAVLLAIFLGALPVGLAAMLLPPGQGLVGPLTLWQCAHIAVFQVAMSLAYVVAYTALEHRSPSMTILTYVADAGAQGRTREELAAVLQGALPVEVRLDGMVRDKMVTEVDGVCRLTPKGRVWAILFSYWLDLLKMDKGG